MNGPVAEYGAVRGDDRHAAQDAVEVFVKVVLNPCIAIKIGSVSA